MLISGFISILQITFLPGFILVEISKIKTDSPIQRWLYIFSFSLFINYGLVTVLTLLSIYTFYVIWGFVVLEILLIIFFCRAQLSKIFSKISLRHTYLKSLEFLRNNTSADRVIFILSGLVILFYCSAFFANIGTIFYFIDTVNNYEWNSWAIDFANNILPKYSSHFPQLLPANWSISYVMIDETDVHFFPKTIMPLFFINNLLIFLDLALLKKDKVFLIGLIICGLFAPIIYSLVFIVDGNADLPVSFFAFLTFYSFIKLSYKDYSRMQPENDILTLNGDHSLSRTLRKPFRDQKPVREWLLTTWGKDMVTLKIYILAFLFAAMAAATKLAGFYIFTVTVMFLSFFLLVNRKEISLTEIFKFIFFALCVISISLFWYFRTPEVMVSGLHQPEYLPEGYLTIAFRALKLMYYNWGLPVFAFFILTTAASLFNKKVRYITLIMVIIPLIIWMFKYSADFRNLSFVVPFLSFSSAFGLLTILNLFRTKHSSVEDNEDFRVKTVVNNNEILNRKNKFVLLLVSVLSVIVLLLFISDTFYLFLLSTYEFIFKYYFLSNRITYFIEYGFLLHVDFYQKVLVALSIILIILPLLILIKIRLRIVLFIILISIPIINFTSVNEKRILEHQRAALNKVDARNYYEWIKMIVKLNPNLKSKPHLQYSPPVPILSGKGKRVFRSQNSEINIHTNFKAILKDKIQGEINFYYMKDVSKISLEKIKESNFKVFVKLESLTSDTIDYIKSKIENEEYKLLFNNGDFVLFIINAG